MTEASIAKPQVVGIWTAPEEGAPVVAHEEVAALAGLGLEGDRNCHPHKAAGHEVTLVAQEAIDALADRHGIELEPGGTRRNLVTRGVELNDLVGRRFRVGDIELEGVRLCHPCEGLELVNEAPGLRAAMHGHGGLRADIVTGGTVRVGDEVTVSPTV